MKEYKVYKVGTLVSRSSNRGSWNIKEIGIISNIKKIDRPLRGYHYEYKITLFSSSLCHKISYVDEYALEGFWNIHE